MPKILLPRAFPAFDPARHCRRECPIPANDSTLAVGLDVGSASPNVAVGCVIGSDCRVHVAWVRVRTGMPLAAAIAAELLPPPALVDAVAVERAGRARSVGDGSSPVSVLEDAGYNPVTGNASPRQRLRAINAALTAPNGDPMLTLDPDCREVVGLLIEHRVAFQPNGTVLSSTPDLVHLADALGYAVELAIRWAAVARFVASGRL